MPIKSRVRVFQFGPILTGGSTEVYDISSFNSVVVMTRTGVTGALIRVVLFVDDTFFRSGDAVSDVNGDLFIQIKNPTPTGLQVIRTAVAPFGPISVGWVIGRRNAV